MPYKYYHSQLLKFVLDIQHTRHLMVKLLEKIPWVRIISLCSIGFAKTLYCLYLITDEFWLPLAQTQMPHRKDMDEDFHGANG